MSLNRLQSQSTQKTSNRKPQPDKKNVDGETLIRPVRIRVQKSTKEGEIPLLGKVGGGALSAAAVRVPAFTPEGRSTVEKRRR